MSRLDFGHIEWSKARPALHRFNLADSAVCAPDLEALGLPHQAGLPRDGYGRLLPALEAALGERIAAPQGRVLVTAGASEANACVYAGLLSPGDQVLVECPGYEPHRALAGLFGLQLLRFTRDRERGFAGFTADLEARITPATRKVVISHLHNPSSVALEEADLAALDRLAERHRLWIFCDETYRDAGPFPLGTVAGCGPRWVSTSSLTKAYGLGGLRIGWVAGSREALERAGAAQNGLSVQPALPSVALALALVPHLDRLREHAHRVLESNRARWNDFVRRHSGGVRSDGATGTELRRFDAGVTSWGCTAWCGFTGEGEGDAFAEFASGRFDLAVTPGRFFGDGRGVRISLGSEPSACAAALDQLERAVGEFVSRPTFGGTPAGTGATT